MDGQRGRGGEPGQLRRIGRVAFVGRETKEGNAGFVVAKGKRQKGTRGMEEVLV
jgi:hypothetical protein